MFYNYVNYLLSETKDLKEPEGVKNKTKQKTNNNNNNKR